MVQLTLPKDKFLAYMQHGLRITVFISFIILVKK